MAKRKRKTTAEAKLGRGAEMRFAHTFALMAIDALVRLDPPKRSHAGRFLVSLADAVQRYEHWRYPITRKERATAAASKLPHY